MSKAKYASYLRSKGMPFVEKLIALLGIVLYGCSVAVSQNATANQTQSTSVLSTAQLSTALALGTDTISLDNQLPQLPSNPSLFLTKEAISDPSALNVIQGMLTASGGSRVWQSLGSALMRYHSQGSTADFLTLDDWSSEKVRYRRGTAGMRGKPRDHDGRTSFAVRLGKTGNKNTIVPEFDEAHVLADHIPAAAAQIILNNKDYSAKTDASCPSSINCVIIYHKDSQSGGLRLDERWLLDEKTHLPIEIDLRLPSLLHPEKVIWKSVILNDYKVVSGVIVPHTRSWSIGGKLGPKQSLVETHFSVGFDVNTFDEEVTAK